MRFSLFSVLLVSLVFCCQAGRRNHPCSDNPEFGSASYKYFGQRTLYDFVRGNLPDVTNRTQQESCVAIQVYLFARHGARFPHKGAIKSQKKLLKLARNVNENGLATLCPKDIQAIKDWQIWVTKYTNKNQTEYGDDEIRQIAIRLAEMLPELFPANASTSNYRFRSTDYQRTIASMRVFAEEVFASGRSDVEITEALASANLEVVAKELDSFLLFYEHCNAFENIFNNRAARFVQFNKFLKGRRFGRICRDVRKRLGVSSRALPAKFLYKIYAEGCYLQQWVDTTNGPWCFPFSRNDLEALDYASDLEEFWLRTNRNDVTRKQSCDIVKDMIGSLKDAAESDRQGVPHPVGKFLFGHTTGITSTAANLGLYKDDNQLKATSKQQIKTRMFRMSKIIPSAGNLFAVLYRCGSDYKVQMYLNEHQVSIPACRGQDGMLCDLDQVLSFYQDFVPGSPTECNVDSICGNQ